MVLVCEAGGGEEGEGAGGGRRGRGRGGEEGGREGEDIARGTCLKGGGEQGIGASQYRHSVSVTVLVTSAELMEAALLCVLLWI
jgi:hypothetical protein